LSTSTSTRPRETRSAKARSSLPSGTSRAPSTCATLGATSEASVSGLSEIQIGEMVKLLELERCLQAFEALEQANALTRELREAADVG
jgi:hypothetical protein